MKNVTLLLALLLATPLTASAQEMKSSEMDYTFTKKDCPSVKTAGEATGVALSSLVSVAGVPVMVMGLDQDLDPNTTTRSRGMIAAGAAMVSVGAAGLITSAILLSRKRQKRALHNEGMCGAAPTARRPFPGIRF